jgi:hypothetical protein
MVDDTDGDGVLTNEEATGEYGTVCAPNHDRRRRRNLNHNRNLKPTRQRSPRLSRRGERSQEP